VGNGPGSQETTVQIVQGPAVVVVRQEACMRRKWFIWTAARAHQTAFTSIRSSRGHWEGDVLVVESTNFTPWGIGNFSAYGTTDKLHIIERWKRLGRYPPDVRLHNRGSRHLDQAVERRVCDVAAHDQEQLVELRLPRRERRIQFSLSAARMKEREALAESAKAASSPAAEAQPRILVPSACGDGPMIFTPTAWGWNLQ